MTKRWLPFRNNAEQAERIKRDWEVAMKIEPAKTVAETAADYVAVQLGITRARLAELNKRREAIDEEVASLTRVIEALEAADEKISGVSVQLPLKLYTGVPAVEMAPIHESHTIRIVAGRDHATRCTKCGATDKAGNVGLQFQCKGKKHE